MRNHVTKTTYSLQSSTVSKIKVLMYHRIVDDVVLSESSWLCLHKDTFRRHLELIERHGFTPITLRDYCLSLRSELVLPKRPIIITFDDGYLDTYEHAFPLLQEFGMKAVIFVLGDQSIRTNRWDEVNGSASVPLMDGQQIVEMHTNGFEIGSHSMTHAKLTEVSRDQLWEEVSRSRMILEILLNSPVQSFSYPYGLVNKTVERAVTDAGYSLGCSVFSGPPSFETEPFQIRRIEIRNSTTAFRFVTRILSPYPYYSWFRWKLGLFLKQKQHAKVELAPAKISLIE